jgi:hypothetical protein
MKPLLSIIIELRSTLIIGFVDTSTVMLLRSIFTIGLHDTSMEQFLGQQQFLPNILQYLRSAVRSLADMEPSTLGLEFRRDG